MLVVNILVYVGAKSRPKQKLRIDTDLMEIVMTIIEAAYLNLKIQVTLRNE